jgi:hypothetical protein
MRLKLGRQVPRRGLQRPAKSPSAALLIWHCTICSPFIIVNLNTIKSLSYPHGGFRQRHFVARALAGDDESQPFKLGMPLADLRDLLGR